MSRPILIVTVAAAALCARASRGEESPDPQSLAAHLAVSLVESPGSVVGQRVSLMIGGRRSARAVLRRVTADGIEADASGMQLAMTWQRLGPDGMYVLTRLLAGRLPPAAHEAHLALGVALGRDRTDSGFDERLGALAARDPSAAARVTAARERAAKERAARAPRRPAKKAKAAVAKKDGPRQVATRVSKPLRLRGRRGEVIAGLKIAVDGDADGPAVMIEGCEDLTLVACEIGPSPRAVAVSRSTNIRIVNCFIHDTKNQPGVELYKVDGVLVQGNRIERISSGAHVLECTEVRFVGNYVENCTGPMPRGQIVQFDKVVGAGNIVKDNFGINFRGESRPEDMISLYKSHGTAESPILIEGNFLVGDPHWGSEDKSKSGSGVMIGDSGGSYQTIRKNVLIAPGQVGIGVSGGSHVVVEENVILGPASNVSNVGIYVWNQTGERGADVLVRRNIVAWRKGTGRDSNLWRPEDPGFDDVRIEDNTLGAWRFFKTAFPRPPSAAPTPPVPYEKPHFPWDVAAAVKEKAERLNTALRNFP